VLIGNCQPIHLDAFLQGNHAISLGSVYWLVVRGGACKNPLAIVPQFSSSLHAGNVRATWQGIEPCETGLFRITPSQATEEKRLRHQFNSRFLIRTIQSQPYHAILYYKTGRRLTARLTALKKRLTARLTACLLYTSRSIQWLLTLFLPAYVIIERWCAKRHTCVRHY